jgi:hypothetical protein
MRRWWSRDTGQLHCSVRVTVFVEHADGGQLQPVEFHVDSGASITRMSATAARTRLGNATVPARVETQTLTFAGHRREEQVHPGQIRARFRNDVGEQPFVWPVDFVVDTPASGQRASTLLGLSSILGQCRWTFDGTATDEAPGGTFLLEAL